MKKLKQFIARNFNGAWIGGLIGLILSITKERIIEVIPIFQKLLIGTDFGDMVILIFIFMTGGILIDHLYIKEKWQYFQFGINTGKHTFGS